MLENAQYSVISHFWVFWPGLLHESQNESILAERAFLEAKRILRAKEAGKQTQREEEKKDGEERDETDQREEEDTATSAQPASVKQGEVAQDEKHRELKTRIQMLMYHLVSHVVRNDCMSDSQCIRYIVYVLGKNHLK